ncbi:unnamed protein product [Mytilus edulis]|uniref:Uncharacterized protein n=1 Tax=Mytilus edulis TaxID=6550 RepID=A0A8S3TGT6_MYTED|nr:unnamed protein product [Mytilus edulis]
MSPSRSIANIYWVELGSRPNALPLDCTVDDCFLIGLPWNQVNECVNTIVKSVRRTSGFLIPRANGPPFQVDEKIVAELSDLDIVSIKECSHLESLTIDEKHLEEQNLFKKVVVYHQPGSGGTTTSRQVLWDLRQNNRCCIVKKITTQTCDQVGRFRVLGEEENEEMEVNPVLLLLDSNNEEEIAQFVDDLESESYKYSCNLFCVLLICFRVAALPFDRPPKNVMLRQELSTKEHHWFKEKYETLLTKYKQQRGCDPHTLLAFNIMKENFNMESINKSVKEFAGDCMISPKQRTMLKHIAFFNAFDLQFSSIPLSCFDPIMKPPLQWIKHLPPAIRVLTSRIRRQGYGGQNASIRMSNYLLSRPVLNAVLDYEREHGSCQDTIGEVALEVISSNCFKNTFFKHEHKILRNILGDIMKKRDRGSSNKGRLDKFSPLITELLEQKDIDQAVRIVATTYGITDDPLVAQQLARLNAEFGNWKEAHTAIDNAITQKPINSYLIHTKGHLYKEQLQVSFSGCLKDGSEFSISNVNEVIELTNKSMECFRKCQKLSESIDMSQQNPAGYESEILMAIELLKRLDKCTALKPLGALFRGSHKIEMISPDNQLFLNGLPSTVDTTIEKVERIIHGMNRNSFHSNSRSLYTFDKKQLDKHKQDLTKYFYQDNSNIAVGKPEASVRVNVFSFMSGIRCPEINHLISAIQSMSRQAEDLRKHPLRIFLSMNFSVALTDSQLLLVDPSILLSLSRRFYETQNTFQSEIAKLESYLYFTTFHWPLNSRTSLKGKLSPFSHWSKALFEWQEMGSKTSSKKCNHKLFFYIGSSGAFPGFVKSENITTTNQLAIFHGKVNDNGTEITIKLHSFQTPNGPSITIPFYKRLGRNTTYNRKIDVVIGFGLNGPKADWLEKPSSFRKNQRSYSNRSQTRYHSSVITTSHFQGDVSEEKTGNREKIGAVSQDRSSRIRPWSGSQKQQPYPYQSFETERRTIENNAASTNNYRHQQIHFQGQNHPVLPMFDPHVRPPLGPIAGNERMMFHQRRGFTQDVDNSSAFTPENRTISQFRK